MTLVLGILLGVIGTIVGAVGAFYLKIGASKLSLDNMFSNIRLWFGIFTYVIGLALFVVALRFGDLNIIFPITGLTYVWSLVLAKYILKEAVTLQRIIGIILVMCGVMLAVLR